MKSPFHCSECMHLQDYALVDAYAVFDRVGEGVMFEVHLDAAGKVSVNPDPDALVYLKSIRADVAAWCANMKRYAEKVDLMTCPECGGDIYLDEDLA